jgi:predicted PurR-regulated permease PerM
MEGMSGRSASRGGGSHDADDPTPEPPAADGQAAPGEHPADGPEAPRAAAPAAGSAPGAGDVARQVPDSGNGQSAGADGVPGRLRAAASRLPREPAVPAWLQRGAAWSWRLLLIALLVYVAFRVAVTLRLVVLPCIAALLLTALLRPLTSRLLRAGLRPLAATWCTILAAVIVLAGLGVLAFNLVSAQYPTLQTEVKHTVHQVQTALAGSPFHLNSARLQQYTNQAGHFLAQHQSMIEGTVLTGGRIIIELLTGLVLMLFVTFFLLKDGDRIWAWLIRGLPDEARGRADRAAAAAWTALVNYVRGTTAIAAIHAVVIGVALWLLGVPLLVPLIIVVFIAAFVPLIGIFVAGALAILVTLGTKGWIAAVILLGVFVLEGQLEGHLLQPQVVGRIVRLHPLAIILVLAVGAIIGGIAGAIVAVPAAAALCYAWPHLRTQRPPPGGDAPDGEE